MEAIRHTQIKLTKVAYFLSLLFMMVLLCFATGYFYEVEGIYSPIGNIASLILIMFLVELITFIPYILLSNPIKYSINKFFLIWYFIHSLYFVFVSIMFHCDFALVSFNMFILVSIVGGIVLLTSKCKQVRTNGNLMSSIATLFFSMLLVQLFYFFMMYGVSTPYRTVDLFVNANDGRQHDINLQTPINCIKPQLFTLPIINSSEISYNITLDHFYYYESNMKENIFYAYDIMVTCGHDMIIMNYSIGSFIITNMNNHSISYVSERLDGRDNLVLVLVPLCIIGLVWFGYNVFTTDYGQLYKRVKESKEEVEENTNDFEMDVEKSNYEVNNFTFEDSLLLHTSPASMDA